MNARARTAVLLALALLALAAVAAPGSADLPRSAGFELDGVDYEYAAGVLASGNATLRVGGEDRPLAGWRSCAFVMLHPGTPNGRVMVAAAQGVVPAALDIDQLVLPDGTPGYAYDAVVEADGARVPADVAFGGNASIKAAQSRYADPVGSSGDSAADKDLPDLRGFVALTRAGLRDDATGKPAQATERDEELHVWIGSDAATAPRTVVAGIDSGRSPNGMVTPVPPTEAFGQLHLFENLKLGGTGTLDVTATAPTLPGANRFSFEVLAPDGASVGNFTLEPSLLGDARGVAEFDLDQLGVYAVRVAGTAQLGSFEGSFTQAPPDAFALHLWWENVTYGHDAYQAYDACKREVGGNQVVGVASVVDRPQPPRFRLGLVATGVAGAFVVAGIAVKFASDQFALTAFRKSR